MRASLPFAILVLTACHSQIHYPPGGYDYPLQLSARDTNYYHCPIRTKISRRDSLRNAWDYKTYRTLDEPNLSLKPMPADVFRLTYSEALDQEPVIITLTPDTITVKIAKATGYFDHFPDTSLLTPLERQLVTVLDRNYPIDDSTHHSTRKQHYLDSLGRLYPQLYNPACYDSLVRKELASLNPIFTYTTKKIPITRSDFIHLVTVINASGYWRLPPKLPCQYPPMDGWGYDLEANTAFKYNFVSAGSCEDSVTHPFTKACQQLVRYAGMDKRIHLYSELKSDTVKQPLIIEDVQLEDVKQELPKHKHRKPRQNASPKAK
jgi:hypothetical protein